MIYEDDIIFIEREESEIPWIKIFTKTKAKEITDLPSEQIAHLWAAVLECERSMRDFYNPDKINIASFANYVPKVHIHLQARFKNDSFFPESMWGKKMRKAKLNLPNFDEFAQILSANLKIAFK
ncbi:HIT domain-containing protein [Campylobacter sp. JMF_01 NE2]|uniref:HIT family protein n=1 Tax=unclassified Campylobacter TaxID=2593542 RepID=UPI0022EA0220|nr:MULTISPECIES: HIT domain-containing protein [unclassified Campylobacter]MDA3052035.1 HIT domain-containing protein [Campylobacter sp. JMF_03 NE3]MDA3066369.1 HIT domain-containing protein [Campylobacter sp. JMF_01 NE2]